MIARRRHAARLAVLGACAIVVFAPAVVLAAGDDTAAGDDSAATTTEATVEQDRPKPSEDQRQMRAELKELASAWADGGGTFGYPFWEKARERWLSRQITASMYREYVTGYRDRLVIGCDLVDQVDVSSNAGEDVRRLVLDACDARVDALRAEQQSLDAQIRRDGGDPDVDPATIQDDIDELDTEAQEAWQKSFRGTRLAMDLAQSELDRAGLERLAEDAFV